MEERIGRDTPPPLTHVEYYYGFIGVVIAWQLVFLVVSSKPGAYRSVMPIAVLEKLAFAIPAFALYAQKRLPASTLAFGIIDAALAVLFALAYVLTDSPT